MTVYVGIDPSINSTGICIMKYDGDKLCKTRFFIVKPNKLTRKEELVNLREFSFELYEKSSLKEIKKEDNHEYELEKTINIMHIVDKVFEIIKKNTSRKDTVNIVMEGLSYGSSQRTQSIFDLAGLNYLIRNAIIKSGMNLIICPPAEIKKFASGKGNSNKDIIVEAFMILFPKFSVIQKLDDLADAYFMCCYANAIV